MHETIGPGFDLSGAPVASGDEVARLAEAFNRMMAELRQRHLRLVESQEDYRRLYEKLQELYRLKSVFVADASHHLRTPLTVIGGEIEIALRQERQAREYEEVLHVIADETKQLGKIVDNLLTLGKAEAGNLVFWQEEVDLTEICSRQIKKARLLAKDQGLQMKAELATGCLISGDPNRLAELVFNLLENAVKYTPAGGALTVMLENTPGQAVLKVVDTGAGIAADEIGKIFERFYRGQHTRAQVKGAGLGLAICKSIAEAHGGAIRVTSVVGKGSTFEVTLPRAAPKLARA
jgi:signal transduction histidine kinase